MRSLSIETTIQPDIARTTVIITDPRGSWKRVPAPAQWNNSNRAVAIRYPCLAHLGKLDLAPVTR